MDKATSSAERPQNESEQTRPFLRWQGIRRTHLSQVVNLVLMLATASLGFCVKLVFDKPLIANRAFFCSLTALTCAVALGLLTNLSRLLDFVFTARAARAEEKKESQQAEKYRECYRFFECSTWWLIGLQVIAFGFGVVPLIFAFRHYSDNLNYPIEGQIFRVNSQGHIQKPAGATIHVFRLPAGSYFEPNAEVRRYLEKEKVKQDRSERSCYRVADSIQRQYAENVENIPPTLLSNIYGNSLQEEWKHITARQDFIHLSDLEKQSARRAFWLNRVIEGWWSGEFNEQQLSESWQEVFREEIARGTLPQKYDPHFLEEQLVGQRQLNQGIRVENSDPDGHFSLDLKAGDYLLVADARVPEIRVVKGLGTEESWEPAVWVKVLTIPRQSTVVMAEPYCEP